MSRLRPLAERLLRREQLAEQPLNNTTRGVLAAQRGVNNTKPSNSAGLDPIGAIVHAFKLQGDEQMNNSAKREQLAEQPLNNSCRQCGEPIDWRRGLGLAFADGTVAHVACDDAVEEARLRRAGRRAVNPDLVGDPGEIMIRGEIG